MRNEYGQNLVDFEHCALDNAVPVTICSQCLTFYVQTVIAFRNLAISVDPKSVRDRCINRFTSHDSLNTFWHQYQNARNLWNDALCTSEL